MRCPSATTEQRHIENPFYIYEQARSCVRTTVRNLERAPHYALSAPSVSPLMYQRCANPNAISPGVIAMM
jgi:hypothetical protein